MEMQKTPKQQHHLTQMALTYRNTKNDRIFEELWLSVEKFAFKQATKYRYALGYEDTKQILMTTLFKCCMNVKEDCNLLTYYGNAIINQCMYQYDKRYRQKHVAIEAGFISMDEKFEDGEEKHQVECDPVFNVSLFTYSYGLQGVESEIVNLLNQGYTQFEIRQKLHMGHPRFRKILNNIKNKILEADNA